MSLITLRGRLLGASRILGKITLLPLRIRINHAPLQILDKIGVEAKLGLVLGAFGKEKPLLLTFDYFDRASGLEMFGDAMESIRGASVAVV